MNWSSGRNLIFAMTVFVGVFSLTHLISFPGSLASYMEVTQGQKIFDMAPSFDVAEVYQRLANMGEAGRFTRSLSAFWCITLLATSIHSLMEMEELRARSFTLRP